LAANSANTANHCCTAYAYLLILKLIIIIAVWNCEIHQIDTVTIYNIYFPIIFFEAIHLNVPRGPWNHAA